MIEAADRIKRLETLLGELCEAISNHLAGDDHPALDEEADRIRRELAVEHPEAVHNTDLCNSA